MPLHTCHSIPPALRAPQNPLQSSFFQNGLPLPPHRCREARYGFLLPHQSLFLLQDRKSIPRSYTFFPDKRAVLPGTRTAPSPPILPARGRFPLLSPEMPSPFPAGRTHGKPHDGGSPLYASRPARKSPAPPCQNSGTCRDKSQNLRDTISNSPYFPLS